MEVFLIIVGGVLVTAIAFMGVDWVRGHILDDNFNPFDQTGFDDTNGHENTRHD